MSPPNQATTSQTKAAKKTKEASKPKVFWKLRDKLAKVKTVLTINDQQSCEVSVNSEVVEEEEIAMEDQTTEEGEGKAVIEAKTVQQEIMDSSDDQVKGSVKSEADEEEEYSENSDWKALYVAVEKPVKQETVMINDQQSCDGSVESEVDEEEMIAMEDKTNGEGEGKVMSGEYEAAVAEFGEVQAEVVRRWEEEVARSPEVVRARDARLRQQLRLRRQRAEVDLLEGQLVELEATAHRLQAALKPPALRFLEKVQAGEVVEKGLVAEVGSGEWRMMISVLGAVVERRMEREGLLRLVDTVLKVRRILLTEVQGVEEVVERLVITVLDKLGRQDIQWVGMEEWEVEVLRELVGELYALDTFVRRITEQVLGEVARRAGRRDRAVQVGEEK